MPKSVSNFFFNSAILTQYSTEPKNGWTHHKGGPQMCNGVNPLDSMPQAFYFPPDHSTMPSWFKGMEQILIERSLWPADGLHTSCLNFKCPDNTTACCCHCILFQQPDFVAQQLQLEEFIVLRSYLYDFYLKYHCKTNFLEQYWGASKCQYCVSG